jgi:probable F420-dependent oxidoreductase
MATRGFTMLRGDVSSAVAAAAGAEQAGFGSTWSPEFYTRSAVVTLAAVGQATSACRVGSSIAYATGRSPLILATDARSLDEVCGGRLVLGLGTGTRRMMRDWHGVDPDGPAARLEELIPLLRRLWRLHEGPVRHTGRFYRLDITPTAETGPPVRADIPVFTAGVNRRMIEVAGRVADGFLGHPLFGAAYYDEIVRPAIDAGAAHSARDPARIEIAAVVICAVAEEEEQARREAASQLAFYAAPKSYAPVLDVCGFGAAGQSIRAAFGAGDFEAMRAAVPAAMIDAMAVAGTPAQVGAGLVALERAVDHVIVYPASFGLSDDRYRELVADLLRYAAPAVA